MKRPDENLVFHRHAAYYPRSAIRAGDFKPIKIWKSKKLELHNLRDDLGESTDLAEKLPEKTRELHARLIDYLQKVNAEVLHGYGKSKDEDQA